MKKLGVLVIIVAMFIIGLCNHVSADEYIWGKWKYESPDSSVIYTFKPQGIGNLDILSTSPSLRFVFFYVIEAKTVAGSSVDSFWEYIIKVWFPDIGEEGGSGKLRIISEKDGKIEITDGHGKNLQLVRFAD